MGTLISLQDAHEQTLKLLPWYLNGTLDDAEAAMVEAHLAECDTCSAEIDVDRGLRDGVARLGLDVDHGWEALRQRMHQADVRPSRLSAWRRRIGRGWLAASAIAASVAAIAMVTLQPALPDHQYHALAAAPDPSAARGNAIVLFAPDISAGTMREALVGVGARITDGPLASGGLMVRLAPATREAMLTELRAKPGVVMAEPLDAPAGP